MPSCIKEVQAIHWERSLLFKVPSNKSSQFSCQSCRWISLGWYQLITSWKVTKAQYWTLPANLQALPWPHESAEQQRWPQYGKGWVSIDHTVCDKWVHWLHTTKSEQLLVGNNYGLSQFGPRGRATGSCSCDLLQSCLKWLTMGSTSNYSPLYLFDRNFVIFTSNFFSKAHE